MPYCEVSKLARGVHSQDVYRVPDGRKYCASMGSRCFPCLFPISWQKLITAKAFVQRRAGARPSAVLHPEIRRDRPATRPGCGSSGLWCPLTPYTKHPTSHGHHASGGQSSSDGDGAGGASAACSGGCVSGSAMALCALWLAVTLRSHSTELVDGMSLIVFQSCGTSYVVA